METLYSDIESAWLAYSRHEVVIRAFPFNKEKL